MEHKTNTQEYEVNRARGSDSQYQTKEERRVITGSEQKTSRANGETRSGQVTRRNHNGKTVITKGVTSNVIDRQKHRNMRKGIKLYGLLNHKKCFYGGSLFLLLLFITSCKSNQFLIDSNEVENVNFGL